jgi:heme/copper-type cytochrome/quinol oxidase subunit 2
VPGNSQAVAGFVLSVVAAGLLVVSFGTSSIISLVCAVLGIVFSRKGRRNVEEGRTPKHGDLARAGFITGIVALVLTLLATAAWIAVIAAVATDGSA